jgi:hypothetical protein
MRSAAMQRLHDSLISTEGTMKRRILGAAAALAIAGTAHAQSSDLHGFVGMALTGGGDTLVEIKYTDGSTQDIKAGGLIDLKAGIDYRQAGSPFSIQASIGYHTDSSHASNGSVRFDRYPIELLGFWHATDKLRVGGGLRVATSPRLHASGTAASYVGNTSFDSQAGAVVEGEYFVLPRFGITLRAVDEKYKAPNGEKIDGSHIGLRLNYYFL